MSLYTFDTELDIWLREDAEAFNYNDGDESEEYLLKTIKETSDKSIYSEELMSKIKDWPSRYHLTPTRHNLLRPLNINNNMSVLEIGCGCGAITRYIAENAGIVVGVEGSRRRASIASARCSDMNNVSIYCDNFDRFEVTEKFDLVTLIGVLEYAPSFVQGTDPVRELLQKAKRFLKPNGKIIVAIENRLGLKYFNGAAEDHTGKLFDGVNDFYGSTGVVTYGKKELSDKLKLAGFSGIDILYPFPDYKLPNLVVSENAFEMSDFYVDQIIGQYRSQDYSGQENRLFHEERAWNVLAKNMLATDFANSFLVIAGIDSSEKKLYPDSWLASIYSTQRRKEYATETQFNISKNESIIVSKYKLFDQKPSRHIEITHHLDSTPYIKGEVFSYRLSEVFRSPDTDIAFQSYIAPWIEYLKSKASKGILPGRFLDCTPNNIVRTNTGELIYIDDEWELIDKLSLKYVIFRGLLNTITQLENHEKTSLFKGRSISQFIMDTVYTYEILMTEQDIFLLLEEEAQLNESIYPNDKRNYLEFAVKWINQTSPEVFVPSDLIDTRIQWKIEKTEQPLQLKVYWAEPDSNFDETRSELLVLKWDETVECTTKLFLLDEVEFIRLDPQIFHGWGLLSDFSVYDEKNNLIYSTDTSFFLWKLLNPVGIVSQFSGGAVKFIAQSDSGHWLLRLSDLNLNAKLVFFKFHIQAKNRTDNMMYQWLKTEQEYKDEICKQNSFMLEEKLDFQKALDDSSQILLANQRYINQLQQEIELMVGSRSWRLTKGIRTFGSLLRKSKKKIKKRVKLVLQKYRLLKQKRRRWDELLAEIHKIPYTLIISHTDYLVSMGGTEKSILEQTNARTKSGEGTIVIFPAQHHSFGDTNAMNRFGIYVDQKLQGYFSLSDSIKFFEKIFIQINEMHIHHLLFWQYSDFINIQDLFVRNKKPITYFAHDFFISCSSYHMIQENEKGSQPCIEKMKSELVLDVCSDCIHGRNVELWRKQINSILKDNKVIIVPSEFVKETVEMIYPGISGKIIVKPHLKLIETDKYSIFKEGRKPRIAYLGYKMDNKGWKMWEKIYSNNSLKEYYEFYHIGSTESYSESVKSFSYSFVESGPMAAVDVLEKQEIDIVLLLSIVPESYSYTLQEALAAGTYIITTSKSGNIAHTIQNLGVETGIVLNSDSAIMHFISDYTKVIERIKKSRPKYKLVSNYEEKRMI